MSDAEVAAQVAEEETLSFVDCSIAIACARAREAAVFRFQEFLAVNELTEQQWRTLRVLYEEEPILLTKLCQLCCIHKVSMARILKYLEQRGLAFRTRAREDKRAYYVSLTDAGRALMAELTPRANRIHDTIAKDFGRAKTRLLLQLLNELAQINHLPAE